MLWVYGYYTFLILTVRRSTLCEWRKVDPHAERVKNVDFSEEANFSIHGPQLYGVWLSTARIHDPHLYGVWLSTAVSIKSNKRRWTNVG